MKILAIDTSSTACSVALLVEDTIHLSHQIAPLQQAQLVLGMVDELMHSNHMALSQLDALAFGRGPGSFTGVRIATSVMQGMGFALDLPLIALSSLAALAQSAYDDLGWKKMVVAIDARIQEVYWALYQINAAGLAELIGKEIVCPPQQVLPPADGLWQGVGNAWEVYRDQLPVLSLAPDPTRLPSAAAIARLAKGKYLKKEWIKASEATPVYLRDDVAKPSSSR